MQNDKLIELYHGVWDNISKVSIGDIQPYLDKFNLMDELAPVGSSFFIIVNLTTYKYEFLGSNQELVTNYDNDYVKEEGVRFLVSNVHPDDGAFIIKNGYTKFVEILQQSGRHLPNTILHCNFRFRHKDGHYVHLVEQDQLLDMGDESNSNYILTYICEIPYVEPFRGTVLIKEVDITGKICKIIYEDSYHKPSNIAELSNREYDIVRLIARGKNNYEIADTLFISHNTVQTHRKNILEKMEMHSMNQVVATVIARGMV